ncbi:hypothetical protein KIH86_19525 [Paenibacillus sp. HN-1]|uniref:hypothetical protein n=1 Tax=Paenibacillus TaxID=44249 RepID=UPI001CA8082E|nr:MULTISPECIES: hypothetical protein [Paenibacillus]MBY9082236.1 hypothetical protein [Paenibacillus sp. CGMCC 1.18879]MBY9086400.1 hypothetical protein [Paenibacillus sinensis]
MNLYVHNLTAFNQQYFRPQPAVMEAKRGAASESGLSFQEILNEKMSTGRSELKNSK